MFSKWESMRAQKLDTRPDDKSERSEPDDDN